MRPRFLQSFPLFACTLLLGTGGLSPVLTGQTNPAPVRATPPLDKEEEVVELTPFEVKGEADDGYSTVNSNSITNFNAELRKLPMSADVFTRALMDDTNSTTLEAMLREFSAGSGTGSAAGDVNGIPVNQPMDRGGGDSVSAGVQLRGLGAAVVKQDSFMLPSPAGTGLNSNFGVERVEVINGPQALLYGNGGGGGVVNIISKQARFGKKPNGSLKFQIDDESHYLGQLDYGFGTRNFAVAISLLNQELGDNRDWMGGPLKGYYAQLAFRRGNTVLRFTGKQTDLERYVPRNLTLNAGSTTADARHGQNLRYLLASGQIEASATGASGAGVIGNGFLNWDNIDSYGGTIGSEDTTAKLGSVIAETVWTPWLSTQISAGYQSKRSRLGYGSSFSFFSPTAAANPIPGEWTMEAGGSTGSVWSSQPSRSKSFRASALLTNKIFGGKGSSQTVIGVDFTEGNYANENFAYYQADADFNVILSGTGTRTQMADPFWSVSNGPVKRPFDWAGAERITVNGVNYVAQLMNQTDPALVTPQNPQGVTGTDLYLHSRAISRGAYAVNFTQWGAEERLTTLLGLRYVSGENRQLPSTASPAIQASGSNLSFSVGANYVLNSWLRPYALLSDTYNLPGVLLTVPADPYGNAAPISHSVGQEIGVKIGSDSSKLTGSISLYALQSKDEPYAIPSQMRDAINPPGLNGRHLGATGTVIPIERKSQGAQIALVATPKRGWKVRLSAAFIQGTVGTDSSYGTLYNDQFYTNGAGQVTYADGTVVHVRPTYSSTPGTSANPGYIPLTIAMLSTPGNAYYANPDPVTGRILPSNGRTILLRTHATHGPIRTGVTGLPITDLQLTGVTPAGTIVTSSDGDRTTGYPEFSLNLINFYSFQSAPLKGFRVGVIANVAWRTGDYYYYPNGYTPGAERTLFVRPVRAQFDLVLGYERKFKKVTWSTQVNVDNVFDRYEVLIRPNSITGYSGINSAIYSAQPRSYAWTNTIKF